MSNQPSAVEVKILDKEYQVNCPPSDQEALMKSARYLDESMRKIKDRGNIHGAEKIAVIAALNITHDMLRKNRLINETRHVNYVTWYPRIKLIFFTTTFNFCPISI